MRAATIDPADPALPDVVTLLERLDAYLTSLYPPESNHLLSVEELRRPNVRFLVARVEHETVGCGAVVLHDDYAEIKRIYVRPEFRGLKLARQLLERLEASTREAGRNLARLETGVRQPEAILLFERAGYERRGPFGDYPDDPLSIFMEKPLS